MIDEIRKRILTPLDALIDRGIENWRLLAALVPGGTVLFLLLFLMFGIPFGLVFLAGFLLVVLEGALGVGIFLLDVRYRAQINDRAEAADAIDAFVTQSDAFSDWDKFIATPVEDAELEEIRQRCARVVEEYPPEGAEPCGVEGIEILEAYAARLRTGLATKGAQHIWEWFKRRRLRRKEKKAGHRPARARAPMTQREPPRSASALTHQPAPQWEETQRRTADSEADVEAARADKEEKREAKRASRLAKKATKQALRREKRVERSKRHSARHAETMPDELPPQLDDITPPPPPPIRDEPVAPQRAQRGLSEAGAIQMVMDAGFTAHDYDRVQHRLAAERRRQPNPAEVVKFMLSRSAAPAKKKRGRVRKASARPRAAARPGFGSQERMILVRRRRRHPFRVLVLLALVPGVPFAAWRIPHGDPVLIQGEVWHQALDTAPDFTHQIRTLFEELLGNRAVSLVDGPRIYVSEADYELCWPETWERIYEQGYSMHISAEVRPLIMGGYAVAKVSHAERVNHPVASAD